MQRLIVLLALFASIPAPAAEPFGPLTEDEQTATAAAGYSRAFGRVVVTIDGEARTWGILRGAFPLIIYSAADETVQLYHVDDAEGRFRWTLKPGEYVITAWTYRNQSGRLWLSFSVPEPGKAVYVGDLHLSIEKNSYRFRIGDAYDEARKKNEAILAEGKFETLVSLMRPEAQLGAYQRVVGICAAEWGVECDTMLQGLEPREPKGANEGYPTVASLSPRLAWKPAGAEGVRYDVAVYEAISMGFGLRRQRGKLAAYVEGVSEPSVQLPKPLRPGRNYLWSVRVRVDDKVSTWSQLSYFVFFVVGSASGTGQWYGFSTPDR